MNTPDYRALSKARIDLHVEKILAQRYFPHE